MNTHLTSKLRSVTSAVVLLAFSFAAFFSPRVFAEPVVTGQVIEWPDDGWYQVQRADSFAEVCSGGTSCSVSAGTYIVINHTTGKRWKNINVEDATDGSGGNPPATGVDGISVDGSTLSWADDGWYQVQSRLTFATVCEGGRSCDVPPGKYIVINHTTGKRWESIEVGGGSDPDPDPDPDPVTDLGDAVAQPIFVSTDFSGNGVGTANFTLDGNDFLSRPFDRRTVTDADGDGIPEVYALVQQPGEPCADLTVYLPSKQVRSAALSSSDVSAYTRIKHLPDPQLQFGICEDDVPWLTNIGDFDNDGVDDLLSRAVGRSNLLIRGSTPAGTLIDAASPGPYATVIETGVWIWPAGDINGDGFDDIGIHNESDTRVAGGDCAIISGNQTLPTSFGFTDLSGIELLGLWSSRQNQSYCATGQQLGDVNGDGYDDLVFLGIRDNHDWVVYGSSDIYINDSSLFAGAATVASCNDRSPDCDYDFNTRLLAQPVDMDADGYNDLLVGVQGSYDGSPVLSRAKILILHGGPNGLPQINGNTPLPLDRVSQIILDDERGRGFFDVLGDVNGDGATDLGMRISGQANNREHIDAVVFGSAGKRQPYLMVSGLNGSTGVYWSDFRMGRPQAGDWNGDGVDDLYSRGRYVEGVAPLRRKSDPQSVFIWQRPDSTDVSWELPATATNVDTIRVVFNDQLLATLAGDVRRYSLEGSRSELAGSLMVQAVNSNAEIVGEAVVMVGKQGGEYSTVEASITDFEETATGDNIPAVDYSLTASVYGAGLVELFWNATSRFVLIWRDDEIIARTEANSWLLRSAEHESGNYFVTIDYFGGLPRVTTPLVGSSGTLRSSNVIGVELQ